jgi:hypothetical protein
MTGPVTVVVRRKVRQEREAEREDWLRRLTPGVAERFPASLGAEFHRPGADGAFRSVFRLDSLTTLDAFKRSGVRAALLHAAAPLFAADTAREQMTGLEFWFDPPPGTRVPQPIPRRMALVLVTVVFAPVLLPNPTPGPRIACCIHPKFATN